MQSEVQTATTWPELHYENWKDTLATLHMWTQIVGKIRLAHAPMLNQWWQVTLYVTPRGLTTSSMPCGHSRTFAINFDFIDHKLIIEDCDGKSTLLDLKPMPVADFYKAVMDGLREHGSETTISTRPSETRLSRRAS